ncbi:hypothetical protein COHA_003460 [Chlorella ohadii]|uniref:SAM domain-containing protein n=1 Tax=Chlorella ohadii TaxID=2649997 RepID=A0AAD5DV40_9CHLO|nr:hypothetical protein COHA_003460 [Chlorella ohadii]
MAPSGPVSGWSVEEVAAWLTGELSLPAAVADAFKENAVAGGDLVGLSDDDLTSELGLTKLQARKRYRQLDQQMRELRALELPSKLEQARRFAVQSRQQLEGAQRAVPPARQAVSEAQEEHKKYSDGGWYPGKVLGGKEKQQKKADESQAALDAASANLARAEQAVRDLTAQLAEAEKQLAAWRGKESELATAQRTQQELVNRMFAAPAWSASPTLSALNDATRALEAQAAEQGRGVATYGNGTKLLNGAAQKLESAIKALQGTQMLNMMGMGRGMRITAATGRPGMMQPNLMQNVAEMAILRKANDAVASAAQDTAQARQLLGPGLPQVNEEIMKAARAGIFQNVLFGGVMSDIMQAAAVAKSVKAVEQMLGEVRKAAQWSQANLSVYQHKQAELSAQASAKQAEAQAYRTSALRTALEAPVAAATTGVEQLSLI